MSTWFEI